jgi:hypothetical protein
LIIVARIVVIGNAAGGKSTLARHLAHRRGLPLFEVDRLLWQQGWPLGDRRPRPPGLDCGAAGSFNRDHFDRHAALDAFLARRGTADRLGPRAARDPPAGAAEMPPTRELFRTMSEVDRTWLPDIRGMCAEAELEGKAVTRLASVDEIDAFVRAL